MLQYATTKHKKYLDRKKIEVCITWTCLHWYFTRGMRSISTSLFVVERHDYIDYSRIYNICNIQYVN